MGLERYLKTPVQASREMAEAGCPVTPEQAAAISDRYNGLVRRVIARVDAAHNAAMVKELARWR